MSHSVSVKPTLLPVQVDDARDEIGIDITDDDSTLERKIKLATAVIESRYSIAVMSQTWRLQMQSWFDRPYFRRACCAIEIPRPPFGAVTSIAYVDQNGDSQTWSESSTGYQIATQGNRTLIMPSYNVAWPNTRWQLDAVVITHTCGASDQSNVPAQVTEAILALVQHEYENDCPPSDEWWMAIDNLMVGESAGVYV